jgi:hypothetical protein
MSFVAVPWLATVALGAVACVLLLARRMHR